MGLGRLLVDPILVSEGWWSGAGSAQGGCWGLCWSQNILGSEVGALVLVPACENGAALVPSKPSALGLFAPGPQQGLEVTWSLPPLGL